MNRERVVKLRDELREQERINANVVEDRGYYSGQAQAYDLACRKLDALLEICDACDGTGKIAANRCLWCNGTGKDPEEIKGGLTETKP